MSRRCARSRSARRRRSSLTAQTKKLSWQQATFLLMGEYIVIAILSFPSSYSVRGGPWCRLTQQVLGMAGGDSWPSSSL